MLFYPLMNWVQGANDDDDDDDDDDYDYYYDG